MKDITVDRQFVREMVGTHGSRVTPTTVIDGEVFIGFDPERLDQALGLK